MTRVDPATPFLIKEHFSPRYDPEATWTWTPPGDRERVETGRYVKPPTPTFDALGKDEERVMGYVEPKDTDEPDDLKAAVTNYADIMVRKYIALEATARGGYSEVHRTLGQDRAGYRAALYEGLYELIASTPALLYEAELHWAGMKEMLSQRETVLGKNFRAQLAESRVAEGAERQ